ncbi:hypothetical protein [Ammoniphilus resinae]|uniref:Tryptophan-rich sensory protein n=1 Tax=Ammoniphilus resinae TaxID=861532 RepID=A0ABS4GQ19_9BACL|nr:hypothetical protein [Ammoniphilus resinae]MBP1932366.1 tryptophan-rich sensory protein [Ammoniphilus resinae]
MNIFWKLIYRFGKLIGITWMIVGILGAISGLSVYIIGAVPGLIFAWLGWKIYRIASNKQPGLVRIRLLATFVSGYMIVGIVAGLAMIIAIIALFQYEP